MIVSYKGPNTLSVQIIVIRPYYHFFLVPIYFAFSVYNILIVRVKNWFLINYNISIPKPLVNITAIFKTFVCFFKFFTPIIVRRYSSNYFVNIYDIIG